MSLSCAYYSMYLKKELRKTFSLQRLWYTNNWSVNLLHYILYSKGKMQINDKEFIIF